jgi:hypothetical protein
MRLTERKEYAAVEGQMMRMARYQARYPNAAVIRQRVRQLMDHWMGLPTRIESPDSGFEE